MLRARSQCHGTCVSRHWNMLRARSQCHGTCVSTHWNMLRARSQCHGTCVSRHWNMLRARSQCHGTCVSRQFAHSWGTRGVGVIARANGRSKYPAAVASLSLTPPSLSLSLSLKTCVYDQTSVYHFYSFQRPFFTVNLHKFYGISSPLVLHS